MNDKAAANGEGDDKAKAGEGDDKAGEGDDKAKAGEIDDDQLSEKFDVAEILDEYGLDSPDDLKEFVAGLSKMQGKIGENDLDTLIENTKTLQRYQADWKAQEEEKRREGETPEETIKRLEKENKNLQTKSTKQVNQQKATKAAETALSDFGDTVSTVIDSTKELPKEYHDMVTEFMGVDNPMMEVDITDKAAVRRLTKAGIKKVQKFEQDVIKRYRAGKVAIPKVSDTETIPGKTNDKDTSNPKNLKEAKKILMESFGGLAK